jgi:hypothetical protein
LFIKKKIHSLRDERFWDEKENVLMNCPKCMLWNVQYGKQLADIKCLPLATIIIIIFFSLGLGGGAYIRKRMVEE